MSATRGSAVAVALVAAVLVGIPAVARCRRLGYDIQGAIEVDTNENTLFLWHDALFLLENIPCYYSQHNGRWDARFSNASYARIRRVDDGSIVANISQTVGFGFITPFVDEDHDALWLFGSNCNRCPHKPTGPQGCVSHRKVSVWKAADSTMRRWSPPVDANGTVATFNVQVSRVRRSPVSSADLPPHRYVMILEEDQRFMMNNAADGDLTRGWEPIPGAVNPPENGGPV